MGTQKIIGILIILVALGGGGYIIARNHFNGNGGSSSVTVVPPPPTSVTVPTPAWYEAHQDALKADNQRCAQQGTTMPPGLCANVAIADKEVSSDDFLHALNQASGTSGK
ncbi:hypothetical protein [Acidocella sp.]|jgi:hypothetical protein|uniref:hypothetical protein n=1 Tax=Acidocella sp. TaxID=50710 RepID=UPI00262A6C7C|nr:hypothetical protein [Acidocella sp.]MDD2794678.1 hypothetical protein [Acidocella sp.]